MRQKAIVNCESHREKNAKPCVATVAEYPNFLLVLECRRMTGGKTTAKAYVSKPNVDYKVVFAELSAKVKKDGFDPKQCRGKLF